MVEWHINNKYLTIVQSKDRVVVVDIKEARLIAKQLIAFERKCTYPGCDKKHSGRGYCKTHYARWLHYGDPSIVHRRGSERRKHLKPEESLYEYENKEEWLTKLSLGRQKYLINSKEKVK